MFDESLSYQCQYCGAVNNLDMDELDAYHQEFYENCEICDHQNLIIVDKDEFSKSYHLSVFGDYD
ncbi:MAG: CPXCG motif-containing cysteine-rich protein [Bacteroidetes bacterium]|nr:CPXCG motif-containing cysteine-rich protein [Bacteroidota bacterium]